MAVKRPTERKLIPVAPTRWQTAVAAAVIAMAAWVAYANSFKVPFLMDDDSSVLGNASIRDLSDLGSVLAPPAKATTAGRPLLNLSFALNYAAGGESVAGYHIVNLIVHVLSGLALFGVIRRTLLRSRRISQGAAPIRDSEMTLVALLAALCWTLHPVLTESVTYVSQRAEALMGLFYLLTLYAFVRAVDVSDSNGASRLPAAPPPRSGWLLTSVAACAAGMTVKETMVTAPVLLLVYDRAFVSGSFAAAWRRHRLAYAGLAATWVLLGFLMVSSPMTARGVGAGADVNGWTYALTESKVVVRYLGLCLWPHPLVFDYGPGIVEDNLIAVLPWALSVVTLVAATVFVWRRSPRAGFLGVAFFLLLAPTSTVVPVTYQPMAESRLYLPLAAVVVGVVVAAHRFGGRRALVGVGAVAVALGALTIRRNSDYSTEQRIWEDNLAKHSGNWRAHYSLALLYMRVPERVLDAVLHFEESLKLRSELPEAHANLAALLILQTGRRADAIAHAEAALRLDPDQEIAHYNLGLAFADLPGRQAEAADHFDSYVERNPGDLEARFQLANVLISIGRVADARKQVEAILALDPNNREARAGLERLKGSNN